MVSSSSGQFSDRAVTLLDRRPTFACNGTSPAEEAVQPASGALAAAVPAAETPDRGEDPMLALPAGPAIAVLPFVDLSPDPEQYFAAGLTEELIVQLARFQSLRVFGLHTSTWIGAEAGDPAVAARSLGVRYLVRGSVRHSNGRVRVTAHLGDARNGAGLWAERYERTLTPDDLLAVQDDIAAHVTARLADAYGAT